MTVYANLKKDSPISSVEFSPAIDGNLSFFHVKKFADLDAVKQSLSLELGQNIVAESVSNGDTILAMRGNTSQSDIIKTLAAKGDILTPVLAKRKIDPWVVRGNLSILGQSGQLTSALTAAGLTVLAKKNAVIEAKALAKDIPKALKDALMNAETEDLRRKAFDPAVGMFAIFNLAANLTNVLFGAEKRTDEHKLRFMKQHINDMVSPHLAEGTQAIDVNDKRADLRKEPERPKSIAERFVAFMHRNSVTFGEIGLRVVGAAALVFPIFKENEHGKLSSVHLKHGFRELLHGKWGAAQKTLVNQNKTIFLAGTAYLVGKTIALTSKVPDPYNPQHHSFIDKVREQVSFRLSSIIEAGAAGFIAWDAFFAKRTYLPKGFLGLKEPKVWKRDYFSFIGGLIFTVAQTSRIFAKYGERKVNKEELYAHVVDSLALVPPDKLPQLMLDSAVTIHNHLGTTKKKPGEIKDDSIAIGKIYSDLSQELFRSHNIANPSAMAKTQALFDNATDIAGKAAAVKNAEDIAQQAGAASGASSAPPAQDGFASRPGMKKPDLTSIKPLGSFQQELAAAQAQDSGRSMSLA